MEIEKKNEFPYDKMFFLLLFFSFQNSPDKYCNLYMSVIIIRNPTKSHFTLIPRFHVSSPRPCLHS